MSKRKYDHEKMIESMKKLRTNPRGQKRRLEEDVVPNKRRLTWRPAYMNELKQRLSQQQTKVDLQTQVYDAERKLQVFRDYFVDIQLKFFHMTRELRSCRQEKEQVQLKYDALRRTFQDAQVSWLRCGSHVRFLKSTSITNI